MRIIDCSSTNPPTILIDVVVTRHTGLVEFLVERGALGAHVPVVAHATAATITGKNVLGVLPLHLAALAASVTEATLQLTPDQRGKELSVDEVRNAFTGFATYVVMKAGAEI